MAVLAVSGTGTGVGKTVVTAAICALALQRGSTVAVVKAAQTGVAEGEPGDLAEISRLCGENAAGLTLVEGARYPDPLSPAAAARASHRAPVDLATVSARVATLRESHRLVVIEGAGGLLVRFDEEGATLADLAGACDAEVLIVASAGLGTLNTTALTLEALAHRGLALAGVVIGAWPSEPDLACRSNVGDLEMLAARPLLGALPAGAGLLSPAEFAATAEAGLGPALGGRFQASAFRAAQ
ncbi:MAG TPA: dethiobiotin synthase [Frankiaceae bacterium]|nr:dethiobiotin synthase [Frankiaceae bacterium]